ncbi:MAG: DNA-directed RNA polymerase subunit omega [Christensenellales bacterium]|jgi:DNA-directed RNA polymerase subunit omega
MSLTRRQAIVGNHLFKKDEHMVYPPVTELLKEVDCRYSLVIMTSKRARQLIHEGQLLADDCPSQKTVTQAVYEIAEGKVRCVSPFPNPIEDNFSK